MITLVKVSVLYPGLLNKFVQGRVAYAALPSHRGNTDFNRGNMSDPFNIFDAELPAPVRKQRTQEELLNAPAHLEYDPQTQVAPIWDDSHRSSVAEAEQDSIAADMPFTTAVSKQFTSGANAGYQIIRHIDRKTTAGPLDENWSKTGANEWVEARQSQIPTDRLWRFMLTNNKLEAEMLLVEMQQNDNDTMMLSKRGGFSTFAAGAIVGMIDVDLPLTILGAKGITALARAGIATSRAGKMGAWGALGGASMATTEAASVQGNPVGDWASVALVGLGGVAFGTLGGTFARTGKPGLAHNVDTSVSDARDAVVNELGETIAEGAPRARQDPRLHTEPEADGYGAVSRREAAEAAEEARGSEVAGGSNAAAVEAPAARKPVAFDPEDVQLETPDGVLPGGVREGASSVGARQMPSNGPGPADIQGAGPQAINQASRTWAANSGVPNEWHSGYSNLNNVADPVAKAASRFHDLTNKVPFLMSDFARGMKSSLPTMQKLTYDLMENASGIIRNNRSASMIDEYYKKNLLGRFADYHDSYSEWVKRVHGVGAWSRLWRDDLKQKFADDIIDELMARRNDPVRGTPDPAIARAADAHQNMYDHEIEVLKGRPGETPVHGSADLKPSVGYIPQRWLGAKMKKLIDSGRFTREQIAVAIADVYRQMHPGMSARDADIWARAASERAMQQGEGFDINLIGMIQADSRGAVEQLLMRNGVSQADATKLIEGLTGSMQSRGRPGNTKQRIEVDFRMTASNGLRIRDLLDIDLISMAEHRARRAAGTGAMARKGIDGRATKEEIIATILEEQRVKGRHTPTGQTVKDKVDDFIDKDTEIKREYLEAVFSYFEGGTIAGGMSPIISRMRKLTNLSLLNQLGLTQMAELGPLISAVGWKKFSSMVGDEMMGRLRNTESELFKELKHMHIFEPEERIFRFEGTHEMDRQFASQEFNAVIDRTLNKLQRIQGFTSGFYAVRNVQQRLSLTVALNRIMKTLKGETLISPERMADIGMHPRLIARVKQYVDNGTVEFRDGELHKLNLDRWRPADEQDFTLSLHRNVNQQVQKPMPGESSYLFHKDGLMALMVHLKSFPLLAMEKQAYRNARLADTEGAMQFLNGLATAGIAYTIKQTINGREDNLTPERIARGAFAISNITGWIPMWVDPLAGMLGMDDLRLSAYGSRGVGAILALPAAATTIDKMLKLPGAIGSTATGNMTNDDIRTLQTLPLVGNAYGFTLMFNSMK